MCGLLFMFSSGLCVRVYKCACFVGMPTYSYTAKPHCGVIPLYPFMPPSDFWGAESGLMGKGKANNQPSTELGQTGQDRPILSRRNQY
jgi:hypothetical protein